MILSRIFHAGYVVTAKPASESRPLRVAFDPILEIPFSTNCYVDASLSPSPSDLEFDAVFLSHFHDDHCSLTSLARLPRSTPIYLYCVHTELFDMIRALGFTKVTPLTLETAVVIGGEREGAISVTPMLAIDPDVDCVFLIEADGQRILNVVDAWLDPQTIEKMPSLDIVLWPFQTMLELDVIAPSQAVSTERTLPPEWVEQIAQLKPKLVVPSSCQFRFEEWSWMNRAYFPITYEQFAREVAQTRRLEPGESIDVGTLESAPRLQWVQPTREPRDYEYDPKPDPTSEIAKRFPALTPEERARVDAFCAPFNVTLYDHEGRATGDGPTEAIAFKVWRALEEGEQITSMYLRTQDDPTENAFVLALSQDALAFQRAQLRALLAKDSGRATL